MRLLWFLLQWFMHDCRMSMVRCVHFPMLEELEASYGL
uniref:Uncharacterized protein n=1 Tax=Rhizophora mucronata TaxID=61149 RepID=A0A2P2P7S1_RHIMU